MPKSNKQYQVAILETQVAKLIDVIADQSRVGVNHFSTIGGRAIIKGLFEAFNHYYRESMARNGTSTNAYRHYKSTSFLKSQTRSGAEMTSLLEGIKNSDLRNEKTNVFSFDPKLATMRVGFMIYEAAYISARIIYRLLRRIKAAIQK